MEQILGQIVVDDPACDEAERALLADLGFAAVMMVPIISLGETVGLLEVFRSTARPWTSSEIDNARLLAQSLAAAIRVEAGRTRRCRGRPMRSGRPRTITTRVRS